MHMTMLTLSFSRAARLPYKYLLCRPVSFVPSPSSRLLAIRTMSNANQAKSEDEWRAILTPEQVHPPCLSLSAPSYA